MKCPKCGCKLSISEGIAEDIAIALGEQYIKKLFGRKPDYLEAARQATTNGKRYPQRCLKCGYKF